MSPTALRYESYEQTADRPNVVVDGSPNAGTVVTLTHWPGIPCPPGTEADLSAQMAFRYLDRGADLHGAAEVVTNNHFDQDGLVAVYALSRPGDALARRDLLEDLAAAGDFGTFRSRDAARLSMAIDAYADPDRSPWTALPEDSDERPVPGAAGAAARAGSTDPERRERSGRTRTGSSTRVRRPSPRGPWSSPSTRRRPRRGRLHGSRAALVGPSLRPPALRGHPSDGGQQRHRRSPSSSCGAGATASPTATRPGSSTAPAGPRPASTWPRWPRS